MTFEVMQKMNHNLSQSFILSFLFFPLSLYFLERDEMTITEGGTEGGIMLFIMDNFAKNIGP